MPVLPLIDLMIIVGWTSLIAGFLLKAIYLTTAYRPTPLDMTPFDFLLVALVSLLFAISLAARTWVKSHEPTILSRRRRIDPLDPHPRYAGETTGFVGGQEAGRAPGTGALATAELGAGAPAAVGRAAEPEPVGQRDGRSNPKAEVASSA